MCIIWLGMLLKVASMGIVLLAMLRKLFFHLASQGIYVIQYKLEVTINTLLMENGET